MKSPFENGLVLGDIRSFSGVNTSVLQVTSMGSCSAGCIVLFSGWVRAGFQWIESKIQHVICSTPNSMEHGCWFVPCTFTDGTYGSNIGEFPGFGGLIQGQIYIPVKSKIPFFWKPMIFWGFHVFAFCGVRIGWLNFLFLRKFWAPLVFHPKRNTCKVINKNFRIFAQRARTKEAKLQVKSLGVWLLCWHWFDYN